MSDLPQPLTPADCDLRDFAFMPLDVARLRDSDLASEQTPEENWAAVLLWAASWHQIPAGSIPDSDNWMAKATGYMSRGRVDPAWADVKAGAMRGFILCRDGRWYHPVVAEKANDSWMAKLRQRLKTECGRIKKHNDRHGTKIPFPDFETWFSEGCPVGQPLPVPGDNSHMSRGTSSNVPSDTPPVSLEQTDDVPSETHSKGEGEGQREGQGEGEYIKPSHLSGTTSTKPEKTDTGEKRGEERPAPKRNVEIAVLLRAKGVKPFTFAHPFATDWAKDPKVTDDLLTAAVQSARDYKPEGDISPNYLKPIVDQLLNPPPPREPKERPDWSWANSKQGIEQKARELNIRILQSHNHEDVKRMCFDELRKRQGGKAA